MHSLQRAGLAFLQRGRLTYAFTLVFNLFLAYVVYALCRLEFIWLNWDVFGAEFHKLSLGDLLKGSLAFDTSAILYTNALYALMLLLPLRLKETRPWQAVARWLFIFVNSIAATMNLADSVYFTYTGHRTTMSVTGEFAHESNLSTILLTECLNHWYVVLMGLLLILFLIKATVTPHRLEIASNPSPLTFYLTQLLCLLLFVPLCIAGMRGGFTTAVRPITISNANQYVNHPTEAAIVLNTPFSLLRTIGKNVFADPAYLSQEEMNRLYSPLHQCPDDSLGTPSAKDAPSVRKQKNIVVLIVESLGREYIGGYDNGFCGKDGKDGKAYKGYTPFVDSLLSVSLTYDYTFANGRQSIDGMPSILSSIPRFIEPFFLTPASLNDISGMARELGRCGYESAFFHGAQNGSMGFEAFARTTGYNAYYGRTEYNRDPRFGGDDDFDGTWAIWDEPFLQYYAQKMTDMKEPFLTTVFTASSHHPYAVPEKYREAFPDDGINPMHRCIRYADMALRQFFMTASRQPWYKNTIFVLTADHTNIFTHKEYSTDLGLYCVPIIFFDPSGEMPRGRREGIAQQIDIMPTVLGYLGYNKPYIAFGTDLLTTPAEDTWAVTNSNGIYQYVRGNYVIHFDGNATVAAYNYKDDWMLKRNLVAEPSLQPTFRGMELTLKALIQSYMQRMTQNNLMVK